MIEALLARARDLAREHGHAQTTEAHLLLALLSELVVQRRLSERHYSAVRIERHARAALAAEAEGRGYRGGPEPAIDPALATALAKVRRPGILGLIRAADAADVCEWLLARRNLTADITFDMAPVVRLFDAASRVMRSKRHRRLLIDHVFVALAAGTADDGRFGRALTQCGHDRAEVFRSLARQLSRRAFSAVVFPRPALEQRAVALANGFARDQVDVSGLVVEMLQSPYARTTWGRVGVSRDELLSAYARQGKDEPRREAVVAEPTEGPVEVVFHDDDFTTQEFVVEVLVRHFGKSEDEARRLMNVVHQEGRGAFVMEDGETAAAAVRAARAECAELAIPLEIELRAIPVGGGPQ